MSEPSVGNTPKALSTIDMMAYASPALASCFLYTPLWVVLPALYAKYFGLELTVIAAIILYSRIFDGITDTTIGYLSDRHRTAGGSRKPWVITGGIGMVISCYFLFSPPESITSSYYLIWSFVFFLAFTMIEIPHLAWGAELTPNYNRRAKVYNVRAIFWGVGGAAFYGLPLLPFYETSEFTPEVLKDAVYIGGVLMMCFLLWTHFCAPAGKTIKSIKKDNSGLLINSIIQNKPLLIYFAAYSCVGLSAGMSIGLVYIYLDSYLGRGELLASSFLFGGLAAVFSLPLWQKLVEKTSKPATWAAGVLFYCITLICFIFIEPGNAGWIIGSTVGATQIGFFCHNATAAATLGDIIDYGKLKFHQDRGSTYFSLNNLLFKLTLGAGGGIGLGLAGFFGFDPTQSTHSSSSIFGLKLGLLYLPLLLGVLGIIFILSNPITKRRYDIIRRRLATRTQSVSESNPDIAR